MKTKLILSFFFISLWSCKKTKLDGDLAILIGKWEWKNTMVIADVCDPGFPGPYVLYDPDIVEYNYKIEFIKKGKFRVEQSGKKDKKYRLILADKNPNQTDTVFSFYLDKEGGSKGFSVSYHVDNGKEYLWTNHLPLGLVNGTDGCKGIRSVFEKVE